MAEGMRKGLSLVGDALGSFLHGVICVVAAVGIALLFRAYVVEPFIVPTGSMLPTIQLNDRILCEKVSYRLHDIEAGDIICFNSDYENGAVLVKRVIATPGQTVDIHDGRVYVDGKESVYGYGVSEPLEDGISDYPVTLGDGQVWVMGDNRESSADSRVFGSVSEDDVIGRVFACVWPMGLLQ